MIGSLLKASTKTSTEGIKYSSWLFSLVVSTGYFVILFNAKGHILTVFYLSVKIIDNLTIINFSVNF